LTTPFAVAFPNTRQVNDLRLKMSPYPVFVQAMKANPHLTFAEAWFDFEAWERSRGFGDDPSAKSKAALDWVRDLYGLMIALEDYEGPQVERCRDAMEATFVAFARLDHTDEICRAAALWHDVRRQEDQGDEKIGESVESATASHDGGEVT
jgi:hypothetical protein